MVEAPTAESIRAAIREGRHTGLTETVGQEWAQGGPLFVPREYAYDVLLYSVRNPAALPLLDVLDPGAWTTELAPGADVRTDVPLYEVWADGQKIAEVTDLRPLWRGDLVTFVMGTSHILAMGLKEAGVAETTVDNPRPAIYRTALPTRAAGRLSGPLCVTVKFARPDEVAIIQRVSATLPAGHGAPVHAGDPAAIGVEGDAPVFGYPLDVPEGTVPVFWACSYSLLAALRAAKIPWFACHAPGRMLVTDLPWHAYRNG